MGTGKADISGIPFTSTPPFAYDDNWWNELLSTCKLSSQTPSQPVLPYSDHSFSRGLLAPESFTVHSNASTYPYLCFRQGGGGNTIPVDYASGQDTRRPSVLLDTRKWSLSPSLLTPHATSESQFPLRPDISHSLTDGGPNGFAGTFSSSHTPACSTTSKPWQVAAQPVPDLGSAFFSPMTHHHAYLGTDRDHPTFSTSNALALSSSPEGISNVVGDEGKPPVVIYRPPRKDASDRRRSQRACAINIEGLWIDKDDLYSGAGCGSSMISVHECQWAKSTNPCGMWIIGSRSRVGAHIRKWHSRQRHAKNTAECLWGGCAETMLKDSINRHVVTVHLGEAFHCQGCDQEFPRRDVYNQHLKDDEACEGTVAAVVYGAKRRVIDTRQALHRGGGTIHYAGR